MNGTEDRDDRLRKLFSRLPRAKPPDDFQQRVARAVGDRRPDGAVVRARIRTFAIPGMAILLVGVLSVLIYRSQPGPDAGTGLPATDSSAVEQAPPAVRAPSGEERTSDVEEAPSTENAAPPGGGAGRKKTEPEPSPADRAKRGRTFPVRPMMGEPPVNSGTAAGSRRVDDSLAREDSLARLDSLAGRDSVALRDSVRLDSLPEPPDSLHSPDSLPERE